MAVSVVCSLRLKKGAGAELMVGPER